MRWTRGAQSETVPAGKEIYIMMIRKYGVPE
jgi:hypothetical protein